MCSFFVIAVVIETMCNVEIMKHGLGMDFRSGIDVVAMMLYYLNMGCYKWYKYN